MKSINYLIILLGTLLLAWLLPKSYHLITDTASKNIFTYYSSVDKAFCTIEFDKKEERLIRKNIKTNKVYNEHEFDSILPLFYSTQMFADGRMPDSIDGVEMKPREINSRKFFYRMNPMNKNKPHIPLYTLFESMSKRVRIEMPGDFFRLDSEIEFINPETNEVNQEKSLRFNTVFQKRGFQFPARQVAGNPSTRKAYDEGYFIIDNANQIFHLKMVNNMPFLKQVLLPKGIEPTYLMTTEPDDRSFYAFVYDSNRKLYIITTDQYKLQEIPTPVYDIDKDQLLIMANPLYWNINVVNSEAKTVLAIRSGSKEVVDEVVIKHDKEGENYARFVLPFSVGFTKSNTRFIQPSIFWGSVWVLLLNAILAGGFVLLMKKRKQKVQIIPLVWICLTGIYGFIASTIFNR